MTLQLIETLKTLIYSPKHTKKRLIGALLDVHMLPEEELPEYIRRRAHLASAFSTGQGAWSTRWAADIKNWDAHCRQNSSGAIWTSALLKLGTPTELIRRRAQFSVSSRSWTDMLRRPDRHAAGSWICSHPAGGLRCRCDGVPPAHSNNEDVETAAWDTVNFLPCCTIF